MLCGIMILRCYIIINMQMNIVLLDINDEIKTIGTALRVTVTHYNTSAQYNLELMMQPYY